MCRSSCSSDLHPVRANVSLQDKEKCTLDEIDWNDFTKVELRVGRIIKAEPFPEARKPAYKLLIDFGEEIGIKKSSAQITNLYQTQELVNKLVVAVVNFPKKQIGPFRSECLVTGFHNEIGEVALCVPDLPVPLGTKLL
jgi:tRNA-binding protein